MKKGEKDKSQASDQPGTSESEKKSKRESDEKKNKKLKDKSIRDEEVPPKDLARKFFLQMSKIWSTRALQELHNFDRYVFLRTYLLEFIIYLTFLVVVVFLTLNLRPISNFYMCNALKTVFFDTPLSGGKHMINFKGIATKQQFWNYMETNFIDGMFGKPYFTSTDNHWVLNQNILIGEARMRQVRVRNNSCVLPSNVKSKISTCYGPYNTGNEEFSRLDTSIGKVYVDESKASVTKYEGVLNVYSTSGYLVYIPKTKSLTIAQIELLKKENWIGRGTRAVLIDFHLFNPSIRSFAVVSMAAEFSMTGGVFTSYQVRTIRFLQITYESFLFYALFVFFGFICYFIIEEVIEMIVMRDLYYRRVAALTDNLIIVTGICIIITNAFAITRQSSISREIFESQDYHHNMLYMGKMQRLVDVILALHVFIVFVKLFKYLEVNETMFRLSHTIYQSSGDLVGYSVLFFFVILSFALLGMLLFGYQLSIFSSLKDSVISLFRILLGDIEFEYIDDKHSIIGAAYLIIFIVTIYFILMNVFLAIIFDSYNTVKLELSKRPFDFYLTDYIKGKFGKKKKMLDYRKKCSQWVADMLNQGYADKMVEGVLTSHRKQGLKLDSILNDHQVQTLTHELESAISETFNYEYIAQLEKSFKDMQESLQVVINDLVKKQNVHKLAMVKLLEVIKKSKQPMDVKVNNIYNLVKNELTN